MALRVTKESLESRLRKLAVSGSVDMNPAPRQKKVAVEEVVPDLSELALSARDRLNIARWVVLSVEQGMILREAKRKRDVFTEQIKALLLPLGKTKAQVGETRLNFYNAPRSSIKRDLLVLEGVDDKVISRATVTNDNWMLKLGLPREEGADEQIDIDE